MSAIKKLAESLGIHLKSARGEIIHIDMKEVMADKESVWIFRDFRGQENEKHYSATEFLESLVSEVQRSFGYKYEKAMIGGNSLPNITFHIFEEFEKSDDTLIEEIGKKMKQVEEKKRELDNLIHQVEYLGQRLIRENLEEPVVAELNKHLYELLCEANHS